MTHDAEPRSLFQFLHRLVCDWTHSRFAVRNQRGDVCCSRCCRVVIEQHIAADFPPTLIEHLKRELRRLSL